MALLHLLALECRNQFPIGSLVAEAGSVIERHKRLLYVLLVELAPCEYHVRLEALRAELDADDGELVGVLVQFHGEECFSLLLQERHQVRKVLDLACQKDHGVSGSVHSYVAVADVSDDARVLRCQRQQELQTLVNHSVRNHILNNLENHQVDSLRCWVLQTPKAVQI